MSLFSPPLPLTHSSLPFLSSQYLSKKSTCLYLHQQHTAVNHKNYWCSFLAPGLFLINSSNTTQPEESSKMQVMMSPPSLASQGLYDGKASQFPSMAHKTSMLSASSVSILHLKLNAILSFQCWNEASGPIDMLFPVPGTLLSSSLHLVSNFQLKVTFSGKLFLIPKISYVPWLWAPLVTVLPIITLGI